MTVVALCGGFAQVMVPAIRVQMFKTDPASRKKTWSYQIRTKKKADSTVSTTQLKTFMRDTKFSINDSDFETVLRVYKNRTGAISDGYGTQNFTYDQGETRLDSIMINELKKSSNAIALDKDANVSIQDKTIIKKLIDNPQSKTRKIRVEKTGNNIDTWTVTPNSVKTDFSQKSYSVNLRGLKAAATLIIPQDSEFTIEITDKKGSNKRLEYSKEKAKELKVLQLSDTIFEQLKEF